jgi:type IV secretion system protein VirD4
MDFVTLFLLAVVAYAIYFVRRLTRGGPIEKDPAYIKARQETVAAHIAAGGKPWGEALGGASHGASYFLNTQQLIDKKLAEPVGQRPHNDRMWLGGHSTSTSVNGKQTGVQSADLYAPYEGHILTVAPTRTGKGTCHLIPNLLTYLGSAVVNDIKGENAAITAACREDNFDIKVFRFAPFGKNSACWNPLDFISAGEDAWEDAAVVADLLIDSGKEVSEFWSDEGRNFLRGVILHVVTSRRTEKRNMAEVRDILTRSGNEFDLSLDEMTKSDITLVKRAANTFINADEKVKAGILSTLNSQMGIWDSPRLTNIMGKSDFKFEDLKTDFITVYFCIPPERLSVYAPLMRLFFGIALASMTRDKNKPHFPVTFFLDEFPQLGRMKIIEEGIAYLAGYHVRLWLFAQDLGQIKSAYGDMTQSIIANCGCRIFSATSDYDTAQLVSNMCGSMTVPVASFGKSQSTGLDGGQPSQNESVAPTGQPLMTPQEVMAMNKEEDQLIFYQGENPVQAIKDPYYSNPHHEGIYDKWDPSAPEPDEPINIEVQSEPEEESEISSEPTPETPEPEKATPPPSLS